MSTNVTASPLTWPHGWKRTPAGHRVDARFGSRKKQTNGYHALQKITVAHAVDAVYVQLRMMGFGDWQSILSTNLNLRLDGIPRSGQPEPQDTGASVWWRKDTDQPYKVLAIDQYDRVADNIYAIAKTLEAMRGIGRWGSGEILERTYTGFTALPGPDTAGGVDHYQVIGAQAGDSPTDLSQAYRRALSAAHPDKGGSSDQFHAVREAGKALGLS